MKSFSNDFIQELLKAQNYRAFLALFFDKELGQKIHTKNQLSYAEFSRRAGFSSRAFIRDVINGTKRVNLNNFDKICVGLKLNSELKDYFKALVAIEESDFSSTKKSEPNLNLENQLAKIQKSFATKKINKDSPQSDIRKLLLHSGVPLVYAASGTEENGASFEDIRKKCKLDTPSIEKAIKELVRLDLIAFKDGRYYPCSAHLAIERLGGDDFFKIDFERSVSVLKKTFENNPRHDLSLFLSSTFSVQEKHLPELKESLNKVLMDFINQSEESNGDSLVNFVVGLTPN